MLDCLGEGTSKPWRAHRKLPHGKNREANTWGTVEEEIQNELGLFPFKGKEKDILGISTKKTHSICGKQKVGQKPTIFSEINALYIVTFNPLCFWSSHYFSR